MDLITKFLNDPTFWVMVAFFVFVGALARPISGAIAAALDKRADKIRADLEEAEKLREEAQNLLASYQRQQRDAVKEAEAIVEHAAAIEEAVALCDLVGRDRPFLPLGADHVDVREQQQRAGRAVALEARDQVFAAGPELGHAVGDAGRLELLRADRHGAGLVARWVGRIRGDQIAEECAARQRRRVEVRLGRSGGHRRRR